MNKPKRKELVELRDIFDKLVETAPFPLPSIEGYDPKGQQILAHECGKLKWLDVIRIEEEKEEIPKEMG